MRLFLAINPGENIQRKLNSVKEEIAIKSGKETASFDKPEFLTAVKWEPANKLHLTLFFLGEIKNEIYNPLIKSLSEISIPKELRFNFSGINAFPNLRNPRVLIAAFKNEDGRAGYLYTEVVKVMERFNITAERGFKPHITLGRIKKPVRIPQEIINGINAGIKDCDFVSTGFELIQSKLTPQGSFYKVLKIFL